MFPKLKLPEYPFKIKSADNGKFQIFDTNRRKYVALTPEEWVRQNFIQFLIQEKKYPASLISIEAGLKYNQLKKRSDITIYKNAKLMLLVECKAPGITINQNVFDQIAMYNTALKAEYLVVTNGNNHYCCIVNHDKGGYKFLKDVPLYTEL